MAVCRPLQRSGIHLIAMVVACFTQVNLEWILHHYDIFFHKVKTRKIIIINRRFYFKKYILIMTANKTQGRARVDSVLGDRMDEHHNYKKLRGVSAAQQGSQWSKLKKIIDKESSKLVLIEVPKGVSAYKLQKVVFVNSECLV